MAYTERTRRDRDSGCAIVFRLLDLKLGFNSPETMPNRHDDGAAYGPQDYEAFTRLTESFPAGVISPLELVIDAPYENPDVQSRVAELQAGLTFDQDLSGQTLVQTNLDRDVDPDRFPNHQPSRERVGYRSRTRPKGRARSGSNRRHWDRGLCYWTLRLRRRPAQVSLSGTLLT